VVRAPPAGVATAQLVVSIRVPGARFSWRIYPDRDTLIQLVLP
jgi:hypothetical protein